MQELGLFEVYISDEEIIDLELDGIVPITNDLNKEFTGQPSAYAYIAMLAARAEAAWRDSKVMAERVYAETDGEVRRDLKLADEKVTEGKVAQEIKLRCGYQEAQDNEIWMHEQHLIMKALTNAMAQRAQMLISYGAHLRAEGDQTNMLIKDTKKKLDKLTRGRKPRNQVHVEHDDDDIPF